MSTSISIGFTIGYWSGYTARSLAESTWFNELIFQTIDEIDEPESYIIVY
jgi:hypothetical protein